jgi:Holliday junction resolvase RusA-like endonuclease
MGAELSAVREGSGFRLVLPGRTPTKGNRGVQVRPGLHLPSKQYRTWMRETKVAALVLLTHVRSMYRVPIAQPILVSCWIYLPTRQRGDEDNYHKAIGDWLQTYGFVTNDKLVRWGTTLVMLDKAAPRLELLIEPYAMREGEL